MHKIIFIYGLSDHSGTVYSGTVGKLISSWIFKANSRKEIHHIAQIVDFS